MEGRKEEKDRIMPSLVATTSASARTTFVRMHDVRTTRKKEKNDRIMLSLVATTSALAHTKCMRTHYVRTNYLYDNQVYSESKELNCLEDNSVQLFRTPCKNRGFSITFIALQTIWERGFLGRF